MAKHILMLFGSIAVLYAAFTANPKNTAKSNAPLQKVAAIYKDYETATKEIPAVKTNHTDPY